MLDEWYIFQYLYINKNSNYKSIMINSDKSFYFLFQQISIKKNLNWTKVLYVSTWLNDDDDLNAENFSICILDELKY